MSVTYYIITFISAILMSGGLWAVLQKITDRKDGRTRILLGICHDRIFYLGTLYIKRGWITDDELQNLQYNLAEPYYKLGGNGVAKRIVEEVFKLPVKNARDIMIDLTTNSNVINDKRGENINND